MTAAIGDRPDAEVARTAGLSKQTLASYKAGAMPSADRGLRLARALGVTLDYLVNGGQTQAAPTDYVSLPHYDFDTLGTEARTQTYTPLPARILTLIEEAPETLWLTSLVSEHPGFASDGDLLICKCDKRLMDGRVHLLRTGGQTIVRRAALVMGGIDLCSFNPLSPPISIREAEPAGLEVLGLVVASIGVRRH